MRYTLIDSDGHEHPVEEAGSAGASARFAAGFAEPPPGPWRLRLGAGCPVELFEPREEAPGVWTADTLPL